MPKQPFPYPMIRAIAPVIGLGYSLFSGAVPAAEPTVPFQLAQASQPRMNMAGCKQVGFFVSGCN
jgi:hypothetical protein